jgi:hypothetical protein
MATSLPNSPEPNNIAFLAVLLSGVPIVIVFSIPKSKDIFDSFKKII